MPLQFAISDQYKKACYSHITSISKPQHSQNPRVEVPERCKGGKWNWKGSKNEKRKKPTSRKVISLSSMWTLAVSRRLPYKSGYSGGDLGEGGGREGTEEERTVVGVVAIEERERERKVKWTEQEMAEVAGSNSRSPCWCTKEGGTSNSNGKWQRRSGKWG